MSGICYRVPRGWRHGATTEAGVLLRPVRDRGWFQANLLVAEETVPRALVDERRWGAALDHLERHRQGLAVLADTSAALPAGRALLRLVCFDVPGGCVAQLHAQVSGDPVPAAGRRVCDLVATMALDELHRHTDAFVALLHSLRVD